MAAQQLAAQAARISSTAAASGLAQGVSDHVPVYVETSHLVGDIDGDTDYAVPGEFGAAITLIVAVSVTRFQPGTSPWLCWYLQDSLDGEHWAAILDLSGNAWRGNHPSRPSTVIRVMRPVANRLSLHFEIYEQRPGVQSPRAGGRFEGVTLSLGCKRL